MDLKSMIMSPQELDALPMMWPHQEMLKVTMDEAAWTKEYQTTFKDSISYGKTTWTGKMSGSSTNPMRHIQIGFDPRIAEARVFEGRGPDHRQRFICDQELFHEAATRMLMQGQRGGEVREDGSFFSMYNPRGRGQPCVVGHFLRDDLYKPSFEGKLVCEIGYCGGEFDLRRNEITHSLEFYPTDNQVRMLVQLQAIHDLGPVHKWPMALRVFARGYGLDDRIVETIPFSVSHQQRRRSAMISDFSMAENKAIELYAGAMFKKPPMMTIGLNGKMAGSKATMVMFDDVDLLEPLVYESKLKAYELTSIFEESYDCDYFEDGVLLTHGGKKQPDYTKMASYVPVAQTPAATEPSTKTRDGVWFGEKLLETA
jgi:hypothetical protein